MGALRKSFVSASVQVAPGDLRMDSKAAAAHLGYSVGTFYNLKWEGEIRPDFYVRGRPFYLRSSLDRWKEEQTVVTSAGEPQQ